jgi:hypothetical protein
MVMKKRNDRPRLSHPAFAIEAKFSGGDCGG